MVREFRKYTSAMDYLMERNQILYQKVNEWMRITAYEYNTFWYYTDAFHYFKKNTLDPDEDIRSIRMYANFESIRTAYSLGKELIRELEFQICDSSESWDRLKYIGYLIKKYHIGNMTRILHHKDDNNLCYVTGIRRPEDRIMKFDPTVAKMNKEKQAAFTSNSLTEEEKCRLYQAMMNVLLNRVNDEEQDKLIGQPTSSNRVYGAYEKFLNFYVYGISYDVENEKAFRIRIINVTDRRIYLEYNTAIEFCIQVYLLGLKAEFNEYVWNIPISYAMNDMLAHHPGPKEVKISRPGKGHSVIHEPLYYALPDVPDSERKESE